MAMVDVNGSCQFSADSVHVNWLGLRVGGHPASVCIHQMNRVYSQRTRRSATGRFIADSLSLTDVQNADRTSRTAYHPLALFVEQLRPIILTAFVVRLF